MIELREYQKNLINNIRSAIFKGNKRVCAVLGCGGGKSYIQGTIAKLATDKANRVLFLVHRKELIIQIQKSFSDCGVDFFKCEFGMVQTVVRHLPETEPPQVILVDEAHHILNNSYKKIIDYFPNAVVLGFTATPQRMAEGGLGGVFTALVEGPSTQWLIDNHYLAPYRYFGVDLVDTSRLKTSHGDFDKKDVEELMNRSIIFGNAVKTWMELASGKKTIVYCSSRVTSEATAEAFRQAGITAIHLGATTPKAEREQAVQDFRDGKIQVLCNVDLFGEGFDVPDCECVVLLRPTKSLTIYIQQSMRSMRYQPEKVALILDHTSNYKRFGLPDKDRQWTLEGKKKRKTKTTITIHQCENCYAVLPGAVKKCPCCGWEFPVEEQENEVIEEVSLKEIIKKLPKSPSECQTWAEIEEIRKASKYRFYWSIYQCLKYNIEIPAEYRWLARKLRRGI